MNGRSFVLACTLALTAQAHPLGNFSISHHARFHVTPEGVRMIYTLDFAEIPSEQLRREWGELTQVKADDAMRGWTGNLEFRSRGAVIRALHEGTEMATGEGANGMKVVRIMASLRLPAGAGELEYEDKNFAGRPGWKEIVITDEAPAHVTRASHGARDISRGLNIYPIDDRLKIPHDLRAKLSWVLNDGGSGRVIEPISQPSPPPAGAQSDDGEEDTSLTAMLRQKDLPWHLMLAALAVAFGLGALHALEPGHGKTIVAAYLIGSRGTWQHAVYLGAIVTFTHTFTVFCLGMLTLFAAKLLPSERMGPILGVVSGLTVMGLGLWLIWQRVRKATAKRVAHHEHVEGCADHDHQHLPPEKVSAGSLIALGVSGGLVPCPSAVVLLLSCVGMGRVGLGLGLLVSFSVGLAVVLTGVGLVVVFAKNRLPSSEKPLPAWMQWAPVASAVIITAIGGWLTWRALAGVG